jgi:signal transduction histidine kinase
MGWLIKVESHPGEGTFVEISIPLGQEELKVAPGTDQA